MGGKKTDTYGDPGKGLDAFTNTLFNLCKIPVRRVAVTIRIFAMRNCSSELVRHLIVILARRNWNLRTGQSDYIAHMIFPLLSAWGYLHRMASIIIHWYNLSMKTEYQQQKRKLENRNPLPPFVAADLTQT